MTSSRTILMRTLAALFGAAIVCTTAVSSDPLGNKPCAKERATFAEALEMRSAVVRDYEAKSSPSRADAMILVGAMQAEEDAKKAFAECRMRAEKIRMRSLERRCGPLLRALGIAKSEKLPVSEIMQLHRALANCEATGRVALPGQK